MLYSIIGDWKADQYRWIEYGRKCLPIRNPVVKKIYFYNNRRDGKNTLFKRHVYTLLNDPSSGTLLHYIGDDTTATQFPHGNRKRDSKSHFRTCPSVLKRVSETKDTPANVYKQEITNQGMNCSSSLQPVYLPRNIKQIHNAQAQKRQKFRLSHDALYNLHEITYDVNGFVHKIETYPNLIVICGLKHLTDELNSLIQLKSDILILLSYDTTFQLGDFYISPFLFSHILFAASPVIPAGFLLHERKFQSVHEEFLRHISEKVPLLRREENLLPLVADDEKAICNAIDKILPSVYRLRCWNHTINSAKTWLRRHGATSTEIPVYVASMRELFHQATEVDYLCKLEVLKKDWSSSFLQYYEQEIHPEVYINKYKVTIGNFVLSSTF